MRMNSAIPLSIEYADPMRALAGGALARRVVDENRNRNALADVYAQNGAGAMRGDANALAAIAGIDPAAAQGLYTGVEDNRRADEGLALRRADTQSAIGARSAATGMDQRRLQLAEQQAAEAMAMAGRAEKQQTLATFGQYLPELEAATTPEAWDAVTGAMGVDDTPFAERDMALALARGALRGAQEPAQPLSGQGKFFSDQANGFVPQGMAYDSGAPSVSTVVNTGDPLDARPMADKPEKGFQRRWDDGSGTWVDEPIPGSQQAVEAAAGANKADAAASRRATSTDVITTAAQRARGVVAGAALPTTGALGQGVAMIPSTQAAELRRQVDVLKSNATIENLTAMRQASPTGGALGSVTEREGAMLAAAAGALDPNASASDFARALDNYERTLLRTVHGDAEGERIFLETRSGKPAGSPGAGRFRYNPETGEIE